MFTALGEKVKTEIGKKPMLRAMASEFLAHFMDAGRAGLRTDLVAFKNELQQSLAALDHATGYLAAAAAMLALAGIQRGEPPRSVRLSLAQTAHWLTAAGTQERSAPSQSSPEEHMVILPGRSQPVHVIAPPGRAGDLLPCWTSTTDLGADSPAFPTTGTKR